jgi:CubicO group peptidase (beta-lactamase class C family)
MQWDKAKAVADAVAAGWATGRRPGGAIVLFDTEAIRSESCGGLANIEWRIPFTAETVVRCASISKQFLCGLVAKDGRIGFADTLGDHLPLRPALAAVPVARALDMTGGVPDAMDTMRLLGLSPSTTMEPDLQRRFAQSFDGLNFAPGSEISYSNAGYGLVQAALEAKGTDYRAALRETFFAPLGLGMDFPDDETEPLANAASGYQPTEAGWRRGRLGLRNSAAGGVTGSPRDVARWAQALMTDRAPVRGLLALQGAKRALPDGRETTYGLGFQISSQVPGVFALGHGGEMPGFRHHYLMAPDLGVGVIVMTNAEEGDSHNLATRLMAILTGSSYTPPTTEGLPEGTYVSEEDSSWIDFPNGRFRFLGADEDIIRDESGHLVLPKPHFPIALRQAGDVIEGEICLVPRRYRRVKPGLTMARAWGGHWVCPEQNAGFDIATRDGAAWLTLGAGPMCMTQALTPIAPGLALSPGGGVGPWRSRICLELDGNAIRLISNRSRFLRFHRG